MPYVNENQIKTTHHLINTLLEPPADFMTAPRRQQVIRTKKGLSVRNCRKLSTATNLSWRFCSAVLRRTILSLYLGFACSAKQALTESSDLEALRREKRAIIEEERCLKALMDIEKSSGHRKAQMLAALRAEKQRHAAKADYRRRRFTEALENHFEREAEMLREKHDVPPK